MKFSDHTREVDSKCVQYSWMGLPIEEQPDQRLERTWFGGGADTKVKALVKAAEFANSWN
jgi:hypothetical protein